MIKKNFLILLTIILTVIYVLPILYTVMNSGIEDIPLTMFFTTIFLLILPLKMILIGCLLPPVWIFITWYLFVKNLNNNPRGVLCLYQTMQEQQEKYFYISCCSQF